MRFGYELRINGEASIYFTSLKKAKEFAFFHRNGMEFIKRRSWLWLPTSGEDVGCIERHWLR